MACRGVAAHHGGDAARRDGREVISRRDLAETCGRARRRGARGSHARRGSAPHDECSDLPIAELEEILELNDAELERGDVVRAGSCAGARCEGLRAHLVAEQVRGEQLE